MNYRVVKQIYDKGEFSTEILYTTDKFITAYEKIFKYTSVSFVIQDRLGKNCAVLVVLGGTL